MIKVSKLADYAVVILAELAKQGDVIMSASALSDLTHIQSPTIAKVLKILAKNDVVISVRGAHGGYKLAMPASDLTIERIISAIDGPVQVTSCVDEADNDCSLISCCSVQGRWGEVNRAIRGVLSDITLEHMIVTR